jgi:hypothetical protein
LCEQISIERDQTKMIQRVGELNDLLDLKAKRLNGNLPAKPDGH